jgi:hypothetical protein
MISKIVGGFISSVRRVPNIKSKSVLRLQMIALFLTASLVGPAASLASSAAPAKQVPFKGSLQALETYDVQFPTLFVDGSGTGHATHLGRFTYTFEFVVDLLTGIGVGSAEFTAANGDSFSTEVTGLGVPAETPGVNHVVEEHTIVGGTGRFAGASGSFTLDRLLTAIPPNINVSVGTVDGTIVTSKSK